MPLRIVRALGWIGISIGGLVLILGALLFQAAYNTGADSDYGIILTWGSAFGSVLWPPSKFPFLMLVGVGIVIAVTSLCFFQLSRGIASILLFLPIIGIWFTDGWFGFYFLLRELEHYYFFMDAERLGEHWFSYEAVAIWTLVCAALAVLRLLGPKRLNRDFPALPATTPPSK
jgi:hypothetical protein